MATPKRHSHTDRSIRRTHLQGARHGRSILLTCRVEGDNAAPRKLRDPGRLRIDRLLWEMRTRMDPFPSRDSASIVRPDCDGA